MMTMLLTLVKADGHHSAAACIISMQRITSQASQAKISTNEILKVELEIVSQRGVW